MITPEQLSRILPRCPSDKLTIYAEKLGAALVEAEAVAVTRAAAFMAQVGWETGQLVHMVELDDGLAYEGRRDLGNTEPGDGPRFKGRGAFQLTGRKNYQKFGERLGVDLIANPDLAANPDYAFSIAALYWLDRGCNAMVDALDFREVTEAINGRSTDGAPSHHLRRESYFLRALQVLGSTALLG